MTAPTAGAVDRVVDVLAACSRAVDRAVEAWLEGCRRRDARDRRRRR